MKKIRLDLDTLSDETFSTTGGAAEARGTVNAHRPIMTQGWECESIDVCTNYNCQPETEATDCGTCPTDCGTSRDTYCGTCQSECGICYTQQCWTGFDC